MSELFPGLGLVLYAANLDAAPSLQRLPLVYVNSIAAAQRVAALDAPLLGVLVGDERNGDGPSGRHLTPSEYRDHYAAIKAELGNVGREVLAQL